MPDYTLSAKITSDSKELQSDLSKAKQSLSSLNQEQTATQAQTDKTGSKMQQLSQKVKEVPPPLSMIPPAFDKTTRSSNLANTSLNNVSNTSSKSGNVFTTLSQKLKNLPQSYRETKAAAQEYIQKQKEVDSSSDTTGSKIGNLANKIKGLAASYLGFQTVSNAIQYNATMEQYETSFEVMTGSAEMATDTVERLKKIAAETPFEMPQLAETTQLLMNYGFTADEAISQMQMLGDISQGSADKMNRIAMAYGQMSSAGKVQLEDIKQMIEAGFNPLQEISESTGESMESLYDRISAGTMSVDEITASMQRSTSEGGKYFQSMDKQSQTLNGQFSTLKDTVQNKLGNAFSGLTDFLRDTAIPTAIDMLENWEKYEPVMTMLGIGLGTLTALVVAYHIQQNLANAGLTLWQAVTVGATKVTTALGSAFTFLTSPIGLIIIAIGAIIAIGYLLINHWDEVKKVATETWTWIQNKFQEFDNFLTGVFSKDWSESFGMFGDILNAFFANVKNIWNSIKQIFSGLIDFIAGVFTGDWSRAWNGVVDIFGGIIGGIVSVIKAPLNGVIGVVNSAISKLNTIAVDIPDWVPVVGGQHFGVNIPKIPYLLHGTKDWPGGLARINEGGRGELVNLPSGTQVIPHDISNRYAKEAARITSSAEPLDVNVDMDGMIIRLENVLDMDGRPIYEGAAEYTLRKMGDEYDAQLRMVGV